MKSQASEVRTILRKVAAGHGFTAAGSMLSRRGRELSFFVFSRKMTHTPEVEVSFGALPNVFIQTRLPKDEGAWLLRCFPTRLIETPFCKVFADLEDSSTPKLVDARLIEQASRELFQWIEVHMCDEERLRSDLLAPSSPINTAGVSWLAMRQWAQGILDADAWPTCKC